HRRKTEKMPHHQQRDGAACAVRRHQNQQIRQQHEKAEGHQNPAPPSPPPIPPEFRRPFASHRRYIRLSQCRERRWHIINVRTSQDGKPILPLRTRGPVSSALAGSMIWGPGFHAINVTALTATIEAGTTAAD